MILSGTGDPAPAPYDEDPFVATFFARVPKDVRGTFTDEQLDAIKLAFGARGWGCHTVDVRRSVPTPVGRHYLVLLIGRERRAPHRRLSTRAGKLFVAVAGMTALVLFVLFALGVAYAVKMALGLDVFPGIDMLPDTPLQSLFR